MFIQNLPRTVTASRADHVAAHVRDTSLRANYQPLMVVAAALCAGIVVDRYWPLSWGTWSLIAFFQWCLWFGLHAARRDRAAALSLLISLAATGAAWHQCRWSLYRDNEIGVFAAEGTQPVCVEAVVHESPRRVPAPEFDPLRPIFGGDRSRVQVQVIRVRDGERWRDASGVAQLDVTGHLLGINRGDRIRIFGQLRAMPSPSNPGEFDFAEYQRVEHRLCSLASDHPECVTVVARGSPWQPGNWFDRARRAGDVALWSSLSRAQSGLALALILGQREQLDAAATRHFYETGTVHLLSISGLHVGLLAFVLFRLLEVGLLRRGPALAAVAAITIAYALVIDAEPPAVRAAVVVIIICAALYSGRPFSMFNLLAAAAILVMTMNPAEVFRTGTQLSFLAAGTLAWVGPRLRPPTPLDPLQRLLARARPWPLRAVRRAGTMLLHTLLITTAVWLVSAPLVLARFNLLSPVAILLTPLLAIPVAVGLFSGFLLVSIGWLIWPLSIPLGKLCDVCLWAVTETVRYSDDLPGNHVWLPGPDLWWLIGFYAILGVWAAWPRWRPSPRWCLAIVAGWSGVGLLVPLAQRTPTDSLDCTFLSVGHGCAAVLSLPDGRTILYDAGQLGSPAAATRVISSYLWSRGRTQIDAVIISHADVDHFNALPELLRRFRCGVVYVSPVMFDEGGGAARALQQALVASQVSVRELSAGDQLRGAQDCLLHVLHPPARGTLGSDNSNSLVLEVGYRGRRLLLPGDLESPGLEELLAEEPRDYDVVLAPHHGSAQSDPPGFVAWTTPEWAVISGDRRSNRPEVADAYRRHGAQVLNTSQVGAITVTVNPDRLRVSTWRQEEYLPARSILPWNDGPAESEEIAP